MRAARVTLCLSLLLATPAAAEDAVRFHPGWESDLVALGLPYALGDELPGGYRWTDLDIQPTELLFQILPPGGSSSITLRAQPQTEAAHPVTFSVDPADQANASGVDALRRAILQHASAELWKRVQGVAPTQAVHPPSTQLLRLPDERGYDLAAVLLLVIALLLKRRGGALAAVAAGIGVFGAFVVQHAAPSQLGLAEALFVRRTVIVAVALLLVAIWRELRRPPLDAGLMLLLTAIIRLGLTRANVLSEGGIAYTRLLTEVHSYSGMPALARLLFREPTLQQAMWITRGLGLLAPALVVLMARELELPRVASLLVGLILACWPLGSVLASSALEMPALATLSLAGLLLMETGRRSASPCSFGAGCAVLAFFIWGRPEGLVVGLPVLVILSGMPRGLLRAPVALGALAWLGGSAILRVWNLSTPGTDTLQLSAGPWQLLPMWSYISNLAILPFWLWAPAPLALLTLRGRSLLLVVAALVAGVLPVHSRVTLPDPSGGFLEVFGYTALLHPWLSLASGAGLARVAQLLGTRSPRVSQAWLAAITVLLAGSVWRHRSYLGREYGFSSEEQALAKALEALPADSALVLPEEPPGLRTNEFYKRYRAWLPPTMTSLGMHAARDSRRSWYIYRGAYCYLHLEPEIDGLATTCVDALSGAAPVRVFPTAYRSHRQVTLLDATPEILPLALFRAQGG